MGAANFFIGSRLRRVLTSATVSIDDQNGLSGRTVDKFKALAAAVARLACDSVADAGTGATPRSPSPISIPHMNKGRR
jgi:hypothetical protein